MRKLLITVAILVAGCGSGYSMEDSLFVFQNSSPDKVEFHVNDGPALPVNANATAKYTVKVPIPYNQVTMYSPSGPSQIDKTTQVAIALKNLTTGQLYPVPLKCTAGAKVVTMVTYQRTSYEALQC